MERSLAEDTVVIMKVIVSPREKDYVFETLDNMKVDYIKKEFTVWVCENCDKIYLEKPDICECENKEFKAISLCDMVGENLNYGIERKGGSDLIHSLTVDRIYTQLKHMSEVFKSNCALVFEGSFEEVVAEEIERIKKTPGITPKQIKGRIQQLYSIPATCFQYGVSFIQVKDLTTLVKMLKYFDYKAGTAPKIREKANKMSKLLPPLVKLIMAVEGFNQTLALRIYQEYASAPELGRALHNGNIKPGIVKGIGKGKIEKLKEYFL